MSYGVSAALQTAVYARLESDPTLAELVGSAIHDETPSGPLPATYVALGPEDVRERGDKTGAGAVHRFTVSVVTEVSGFRVAKKAAAAISDALLDAPLSLARGRLISLDFEKGRARREQRGARRRIDLTFRARVEDV